MVERICNDLQESSAILSVPKNDFVEIPPEIQENFKVTVGFINSIPISAQKLIISYFQDATFQEHIDAALYIARKEKRVADRIDIRQNWMGKLCETISRTYLSQNLGPDMIVMPPDQIDDLISLRFSQEQEGRSDQSKNDKVPKRMRKKPKPDSFVLQKVGFVTQIAGLGEATISPWGEHKKNQFSQYAEYEPIETIIGKDIEDWSERKKWRDGLKRYIQQRYPQFLSWEVVVSRQNYRVFYTFPEDRVPEEMPGNKNELIPIPIKRDDILRTTEALMEDVKINSIYNYIFSVNNPIVEKILTKKGSEVIIRKSGAADMAAD